MVMKMNDVKKFFLNKNIYGMFMITILWYIMHEIFNSSIIPNPIETFKEFMKLLNGDLSTHLFSSIYRIFLAIIISLIIAVPIGLMCGVNKVLDAIISPIAYIIYPIPKVAFLPVFMLFFGLGDVAKVMLIISIIVFQIQIAARDAVKDIKKEMLFSVKTLGMNKIQIFRYLIVPSTMPKLISAIRTTIGISISALFLSENFATKHGVGYFIMNSWIMADYKSMYAGIIALSILGFVIFKVIDLIERKVCRWLYI